MVLTTDLVLYTLVADKQLKKYYGANSHTILWEYVKMSKGHTTFYSLVLLL